MTQKSVRIRLLWSAAMRKNNVKPIFEKRDKENQNTKGHFKSDLFDIEVSQVLKLE